MIRTSPQPGDIGLTIITGRVGRLVQLGQWLNGEGRRRPGWDLDDEVPYQHAFVVLPSGLLIEAMPGGAQVRPLSAYDDRDVLYVSPAGPPWPTGCGCGPCW
ncbi:hypothetical protein ABZ454_38860 [Streptomyces sp. NPDC005803]|uniref:hypothetical protein n=1 Tax=Streptomyces sp. NPDC005803 TaxID=3154297 RepID=UPI0033CF2E60